MHVGGGDARAAGVLVAAGRDEGEAAAVVAVARAPAPVVAGADAEGREYRVCPQCAYNMYKQGRMWVCENCGYSYVE